MISYRQADLAETLNKPRPVYFSYDCDADQNRLYDPKTNKISNTYEGETSWSELFPDDMLKRIRDYHVIDDRSKRGHQTFIKNDYVGEYDHIDDEGNFVFRDNRGNKFFNTAFSIRDWVLTDKHERGLHLEKRHK